MEKQNTWSAQRKFIFIILLFFAFSMTGCDSSHGKRQAEKEAARKELISKKEAKIKNFSDQVLEKYNAVSFPPKGLVATAFTYELQKFLSANAERTVLFQGYVEDVEQTDRGIVVEFLCPLGKFFMNKTAIRFRLTVAEENVQPLLAVRRLDPMFHSLRYLSKPDFLVVAKIAGLKRSRRYEFVGSDSGDEVEIDVEISPSFISTGKLVEAIQIPND
jgi:hypothetical protein